MEDGNDIYGQYGILGYTVSTALVGSEWWESLSVDTWLWRALLFVDNWLTFSEIQFPHLGHESGNSHPTVSVDACKTSSENHQALSTCQVTVDLTLLFKEKLYQCPIINPVAENEFEWIETKKKRRTTFEWGSELLCIVRSRSCWNFPFYLSMWLKVSARLQQTASRSRCPELPLCVCAGLSFTITILLEVTWFSHLWKYISTPPSSLIPHLHLGPLQIRIST